MQQHPKTLIVEGNADKRFFVSVLNHLHLPNIKVEPEETEELLFYPQTPRNLGAGASNKDNALHVLDGELTFLLDGSKTHLAIVLDADIKGIHNGGWEATLQKVVEKIVPEGFAIPPTGSLTEGFVFQNTNPVFKSFGLWIMADTSGEGAFEDWFIPALQQHDAGMFHHVRESITHLPEQRFKQKDRGKAEITTWRAWQQQVGYFDLTKLNLTAPPMKHLIDWLKHIYQ